jgi:hypothetical protein
MLLRLIPAVFATIGVCGLAAAQTSATFYVSTTGSDGNPGTASQPFRTIQHAANLVNPGDTVIVEDGVYTGTGVGTPCSPITRPIVCLTRGGSSTAMITFRARNRGGAKLDGQSNTSTDGIRFLANANYIRVEGFEIYGVGNALGGSSGIELYEGGHDVVLTHNEIHDVGRLCTDTANGEVAVFVQQPRVRIDANSIHDIGRFVSGENGCVTAYNATRDHGVYVDGSVDAAAPGASQTLITNNLFYSNKRGWSIQVYPAAVAGLSVLNNTFAFPNPYQAGQIILGANTTDARIINNIFYKPNGAAITYYRGTQTNLRVTNNVVSGSALFDTVPPGTIVSANSLTDPLMLNTTTAPYDFNLSSLSPGINAGAALVEITTDFSGRSRTDGLLDIGAYEYGIRPPAPPKNLRIISP